MKQKFGEKLWRRDERFEFGLYFWFFDDTTHVLPAPTNISYKYTRSIYGGTPSAPQETQQTGLNFVKYVKCVQSKQ